MAQTLWNDRKMLLFSFVTASTTVIAGIMHLQMVPGSISRDLGQGILFLVGGLLQVFWAVPVIKRWGRIWQIIGIAGTIVFFVLWYTSRLHLLPEGGGPPGGHQGNSPPRDFPQQGNSTGREFPRGSPPGGMGIRIGGMLFPPIELFQFAFIGLYSIQSRLMSKRK